MKKKADDMRPEYPSEVIRSGERGKYADRFSGTCTVVVLDPDVAEVFQDAGSVNEALREVIEARTAKSGNG